MLDVYFDLDGGVPGFLLLDDSKDEKSSGQLDMLVIKSQKQMTWDLVILTSINFKEHKTLDIFTHMIISTKQLLGS